MHITGRKFAYLMIWLGETSYRVMEVAKDDDYFEKIMKPKIFFFLHESNAEGAGRSKNKKKNETENI